MTKNNTTTVFKSLFLVYIEKNILVFTTYYFHFLFFKNVFFLLIKSHSYDQFLKNVLKKAYSTE